MDRWSFYEEQIIKWLPKESSILIIGASNKEAEIFSKNNFNNITLGYFDENDKKNFLKIGYQENKNLFKIDIREINFKDNHFDYCFTHATIHHVDLPHIAVSELYRVSKKGTLIIESNDSLVMRVASYFNFTEDFEISSVKNNSGGLLNTGIPNYVYRWTEREIIKLINSYKPQYKHKIHFSYFYDQNNYAQIKNPLKKTIKWLLNILLKIYFIFFSNQKNVFSIYIDKENKIERFKN